MPTVRLWTREHFNESVKRAVFIDEGAKEKPMKEMKTATIILEGDLRVKIVGWDATRCVVRYGKHHRREETLLRKHMNFRYLKEKASVVA